MRGTGWLLLLCSTSVGWADAELIEIPIDPPAPFTPPTFHVVSGDLDGDGDVDLFMGQGPGNLPVLFRSQGGQFSAESFPASGNSLRDMALADIDFDGDLDLAASWSLSTPKLGGGNAFDVHLSLYLNDGTGDFEEIVVPYESEGQSAPLTIALADMDHDGDLDLISSSIRQDRLFWLEHELRLEEPNLTDRHRFERIHEIAEVLAPQSFAIEDLDSDEDLDIVVVSLREGLLVLEQSQDKWLKSVTLTEDDRTYGVFISDLDGDGVQDILSGAEDSDSLYAFYGSENSLVFEEELIARLPTYDANVAGTGDFDRDGDQDIAVTYQSAMGKLVLQILRFDSTLLDDPYLADPAIERGVDIADIHFADLNGNGYIDFLNGAGEDHFEIVEFHYDRLPSPGRPFDLRIQESDKGAVQIDWQSSVDSDYQVESSANLLDWIAEGALIEGTGGPLSFARSNEVGRQQFYRVVARPAPARE